MGVPTMERLPFCGESFFLLAIIKTSKLNNIILHQFEGLHKLWDTPAGVP